MRLDKYLKVSRVIKRRTVAKDILDLGFVKLNDRVAKPSSEVNEGDVIELKLGERLYTIKVLAVKEYAKKEQGGEMYEVISDKTINLD